MDKVQKKITWSRLSDLNLQPTVYDTVALPIELSRHKATGGQVPAELSRPYYASICIEASQGEKMKINHLPALRSSDEQEERRGELSRPGNLFFISLAVTITLLGIIAYRPLVTKAAIWPVTLNQDKAWLSLSQDLKFQLQSYNYAGERLFVEYTRDGDRLSLKVFPTQAQASFILSTTNQALSANNPQYIFASASGSPLVSAEQLPQTVDQDYKYQLFKDSDLTLGSDQTARAPTITPSLKNYATSWRQVSKAYEIKASSDASVSYNFSLRYNDRTFDTKKAYYLDFSSLSWLPLASYNDITAGRIYASLPQQRTIVAVFADTSSSDGLASWYDQSRYGTFGHQNGLFAASRDYPKGTRLQVSRLKTGRSIIVTVNDYGPELRTGRLIDLDKLAFESIASLAAGEVNVNVQLIND